MSLLGGIGIGAVGDIIDKGLETLDDNVLSDQEREANISDRHKTDMASDSKLSKNIRPIIAITMLGVWIIVHIIVLFKFVVTDIDLTELIFADASILVAVIGFYFNSRKAEKIMDKQVSLQKKKIDATVQVKGIEAKNERIKERREMRMMKRK